MVYNNQWSKEWINPNGQKGDQQRFTPPADLANRKRGYSNSSNSSAHSNFGDNSLFPTTAAYRPNPRNVDGFIRDNMNLVRYNTIGPFKRARVFCPPSLRRLLADPLNGQAQKLYELVEMAQEESKTGRDAATSSKGIDSDTEKRMANMARLLLKRK